MSDGPTGERTHGAVVEHFVIGALDVTVRHSCVRRDQYEARSAAPLGPAVRAALAACGELRGSDVLYVLDVPGTHQVTVAPAAGRIVVMPRLETERPAQREAALDVLTRIERALG